MNLDIFLVVTWNKLIQVTNSIFVFNYLIEVHVEMSIKIFFGFRTFYYVSYYLNCYVTNNFVIRNLYLYTLF